MQKLRVAFYRAARDKHWLDNAISFWTGIWNPGTQPYSHVEIHWPDEDGLFECGKDFNGNQVVLGECYTSTMRGEVNGNVIRPAREIIGKNPERWDYIEIKVPSDFLPGAIAAAEMAVRFNKGYGKLDIAGFFLPFRINDGKDICSEASQSFLVYCGIFKKHKTLSPRRLSKRLLRATKGKIERYAA